MVQKSTLINDVENISFFLPLIGNKFGVGGGKALSEVLKTNTTITVLHMNGE